MRLRKRIDKVEQVLGRIPIPSAIVREAFQHFRRTGELPDDVRLAYHVRQRITLGFDIPDTGNPTLDRQHMFRLAVVTPSRPKDPWMDALLEEAIFADDPVGWAAREVLRRFAQLGHDPSQPLMTNYTKPLPDYPVGLHLLGVPECFALPPYEARAHALFARCDAIRERIDHEDRRWFDEMYAACQRFADSDELPDDELMRDAVLGLHEFHELINHAVGNDVADAMAKIDAARVATSNAADSLTHTPA